MLAERPVKSGGSVLNSPVAKQIDFERCNRRCFKRLHCSMRCAYNPLGLLAVRSTIRASKTFVRAYHGPARIQRVSVRRRRKRQPRRWRCLEIVEQSGLEYQLHAMGTLVEGELNQVLDILRRCVEAVAADHPRVTCSAKLDLRRGHSGRLKAKVTSVERQLGRRLKTLPGN